MFANLASNHASILIKGEATVHLELSASICMLIKMVPRKTVPKYANTTVPMANYARSVLSSSGISLRNVTIGYSIGVAMTKMTGSSTTTGRMNLTIIAILKTNYGVIILIFTGTVRMIVTTVAERHHQIG